MIAQGLSIVNSILKNTSLFGSIALVYIWSFINRFNQQVKKEAEIAEEIGVAVSSVRSALRVLERLGYVETERIKYGLRPRATCENETELMRNILTNIKVFDTNSVFFAWSLLSSSVSPTQFSRATGISISTAKRAARKLRENGLVKAKGLARSTQHTSRSLKTGSKQLPGIIVPLVDAVRQALLTLSPQKGNTITINIYCQCFHNKQDTQYTYYTTIGNKCNHQNMTHMGSNTGDFAGPTSDTVAVTVSVNSNSRDVPVLESEQGSFSQVYNNMVYNKGQEKSGKVQKLANKVVDYNWIFNQRLEKIRENVDLVEYIGKDVRLKRVGGEWYGLCPFHADSKASFAVNRAKGKWYCHGCGRGGTIVEYVAERDGVTKWEALKAIEKELGIKPGFMRVSGGSNRHSLSGYASSYKADSKCNDTISLQERNSLRNDSKQVDYTKIMYYHKVDGMARSYHYKLLENETMLKYLEQAKGIPYNIVTEFGLGMDINRESITIPLYSDDGKRILGIMNRYLKRENKYSVPPSVYFDKKNYLFNLHRAVKIARITGKVFVVEGAFDAMALHRAGQAAVAVLGNYITYKQAELIKNYFADAEVIFLPDTDKAALEKLNKNLKTLKNAGLKVRVMYVVDGAKDIAESLAKGNSIDNALSNNLPERYARTLLRKVVS